MSAKEIKYVVVEIISKAKDITEVKPKRGLFGGLYNVNDSKLIYLFKDSNGKIAYNLDLYTVVSTEVYDGQYRTLTNFKSNKSDQLLAVEFLSNIILSLDAVGKVVSDFVKHTAYSDVPKDLVSSSTVLSNHKSISKVRQEARNATTKATVVKSVPVKPTPTNPALFTIRTDIPEKSIMGYLEEVMVKMAKGEKVVIDLPTAKGKETNDVDYGDVYDHFNEYGDINYNWY